MSEVLEGLYAAFINNLIPQLWMAKSYPSLKTLGSYVRDLELRLDMIEVYNFIFSIAVVVYTIFYFSIGFQVVPQTVFGYQVSFSRKVL